MSEAIKEKPEPLFIRVYKKQRDIIIKLSKKEKVSMGEVVRRAINKYGI